MRNVPRQTSLDQIMAAICPNRTLPKFHDSHGVAVFAFYDIRHAIRTKLFDGKQIKDVPGVTFRTEEEGSAKLEAIYVGMEQLAEVRPIFAFDLVA